MSTKKNVFPVQKAFYPTGSVQGQGDLKTFKNHSLPSKYQGRRSTADGRTAAIHRTLYPTVPTYPTVSKGTIQPYNPTVHALPIHHGYRSLQR